MSFDRAEQELIVLVAKRIFRAEHPRKDWIAHPTYAQDQMQQRYLETARVIINMVQNWEPK